MITNQWRRACSAGGCLEARRNTYGAIELRSTTTGERVTALVPEWSAFIDAVKAGAYDLEDAAYLLDVLGLTEAVERMEVPA